MDTVNCIGAYGNMLMIFKELSRRIRERIGNARKTNGIVTLEDIGTILKDFEDFMNNNLTQYNKEVKIDFTDNVPQQDPNDVPFEITNLQNNNESKIMNKKLIRLTENDLHRIVKESVNRILMEAQSEGVQVRPYTENVFAVGNNSGVKFYVDRNGRFYDGNMQPTKNVACLTDYDAQQVANQLNKALGNMFHYDMFRGGNSMQQPLTQL